MIGFQNKFLKIRKNKKITLEFLFPFILTIIISLTVPRLIYPEWSFVYVPILSLTIVSIFYITPISYICKRIENYIFKHDKKKIFQIYIPTIIIFITLLLTTFEITSTKLISSQITTLKQLAIVSSPFLVIFTFISIYQKSKLRAASQTLLRLFLPLLITFTTTLLLFSSDKIIIFITCMGVSFYFLHIISSNIFSDYNDGISKKISK